MNRPSFAWKLYIAAFYVFLFAPLLVVAVFAFNASPFPSPPWRGFTLDWFIGSGDAFDDLVALSREPLPRDLRAWVKSLLSLSGFGWWRAPQAYLRQIIAPG